MYLTGYKIHYGDITLCRRRYLYKLVFLELIGVSAYFYYLCRIVNFHALVLSEFKRVGNAALARPTMTILCVLVLPVTLSLVWEYFVEKCFPIGYKQLQHRQRLARMIVENQWCEVETVTEKDFFGTGSTSKKRVKSFPLMFYHMGKETITINVEITMGRYQEQLLNLQKQLEPALYCELIEEELHEFYKEYTFLFNVIRNRISIEDVTVKDGKMLLMKGVYWEFDSLPHALIIGGTGGGKTYFLLTMIEALLKSGAVLTIFDPKKADLADLADVMPGVYYKPDDIVEHLKVFYEEMMCRSEEYKLHPKYKTGVNYAYLGLEPHFLVFDEYVAFMAVMERDRRRADVISQMQQIAMLGRQMGYFLILACQRPDTKYFADGMRDQFNLRVALGRNSEMGYAMVFGSECKKQFFNKRIKGRGYIDTGGSVITEFYTPLVPKGYDFLKNIRTMDLGRTEEVRQELEIEMETEEEY
ncbi:helicase HerA domain-containing protein [Mediterraneibacter massiliensis]|uniref:helicase HerA domain-containing protein n=1 Tax=Mediterraneibacter massiliensis TaxID=1720300 RepID=UPI0019686B80|nr:DUF87 domain-containing protein [Mediterraneibacter massiliensis]